jgi:fatty acid amide hydrolase 2
VEQTFAETAPLSAADDLTSASAVRLAAEIRRGGLSSRDVVEAHIEVLERWNPRINAVVIERYDDARRAAEEADAAVAAAADPSALPPLLGVPFTIKESIAVAGSVSCAGVVACRDRISERTATIAERVIDAGAIPLGFTNLSEMTLWVETENRVYGRTNNPYDTARTAGGSSGGEGAAIATGGSPFGLASDLGGSIRLPSFFCGVFGHKPTPGLVPMTGLYPEATGETARLGVCGPMARRAEDLGPLLAIMAGPDGIDPVTEPMELGDPAGVSIEGLRVAVTEGGTLAPASRDVAVARERAAGALAAAGANVESVRIADAWRALEMYLTVLRTASGVTLGELLAEAGAEELGLRGLLRRGSPHTVATRVTLAVERLGRRIPERRTRRLMAARESFVRELRDAVGDGVLLHTPAPGTAPRHGRTVGRIWWIHPMIVFNLAMVPVTQVPLGLDRGGLPLGVQVVAGHGRDHVSIAAALELERVFGGWRRPPVT